jgi:hypothetical protein
MECLEKQLAQEVALATAVVSVIHSIADSALAASKHGYFSDVHKMHEYAVYLLKRHTRIAMLREAIDTIRKAAEIAETAETAALEVVEI